jgi:hypothetical protein
MPIFYIDSGSFNNLQVTGSLLVTGEIFGTASWATNALTASYISGSITGSLFGTSSWAETASYALNTASPGTPLPPALNVYMYYNFS